MEMKDLQAAKDQSKNETDSEIAELNRVSLYNILEAKEFVERMNKEDDTDLEEYSKTLAIQESTKANAIVGFLRETELTAENAEAESKRLAELAAFYKNRANTIKRSISYAMLSHQEYLPKDKNGSPIIETDKFRLSFRKSTQVIVDDMQALPAEFVEIKQTQQVDKKYLGEVLKTGEVIPGAHLQENKNLQIK